MYQNCFKDLNILWETRVIFEKLRKFTRMKIDFKKRSPVSTPWRYVRCPASMESVRPIGQMGRSAAWASSQNDPNIAKRQAGESGRLIGGAYCRALRFRRNENRAGRRGACRQAAMIRGSPASRFPTIEASKKPAARKHSSTASAASGAQAASKPPLVCGSHSNRHAQAGKAGSSWAS